MFDAFAPHGEYCDDIKETFLRATKRALMKRQPFIILVKVPVFFYNNVSLVKT